MLKVLTEGLRLLFAAGLVIVSLAGSASAQASTDPRLDQLFLNLAHASSEADARSVSDQIWQIWTHPEDPELARRMNEISDAMGQEDVLAALDLATALTVSTPDYSEGWNKRATLEFILGDYEASLADISETLLREPRHFGALAGRALAYLRLGERPKALEAIKAALKIHPFLSERGLFPELGPPPIHT